MLLLNFTKMGNNENTQYRIHHYNGVIVGDLIMMEDGYYAWWPVEDRHGYIPEYVLREIADKLQELNKDWDEQVCSDPLIND